jgi:transposase-like protein
MDTIESKLEVDIQCGRCNRKDILHVNLYKNQVAIGQEWICPNCGTKKVLTIKRKEKEEVKETEERVVTRYRYDKDGKRIEEGSEKKEPNEKFIIKAPKKESKEEFREV